MGAYQHTQRGTLILSVMAVGLVLTASIFLVVAGSRPAAAAICGSVIGILLVAAFLFRSLSVEVSSESVALRFGSGPIRKNFAIADIAEVRAVRNRWYYGWGIRLTPHGWLFNVSGLDAVEVRLAGGRKFRIGTDEPVELCAAIRRALDLKAAAGRGPK